MYLICFIIFTFLAIIGIVNLIMSLIYYFTKIKGDKSILIIIPDPQCYNDMEFILRGAASKVKWLGRNHPQRVICLDTGMDEQTRQMCEYICNDYGFIEIMSKKEFAESIGLDDCVERIEY